jgi:hypothetical protein
VFPALLDHLTARKNATGDFDCDFLQWHSKGELPDQPKDGAGVALNQRVARSQTNAADSVPSSKAEVTASLNAMASATESGAGNAPASAPSTGVHGSVVRRDVGSVFASPWPFPKLPCTVESDLALANAVANGFVCTFSPLFR